MQGAGCLTIIFGMLLWLLAAVLLGFGMPCIAALAGILIWQESRVFGGIMMALALIAAFFAVPLYLNGAGHAEYDVNALGAAVMQGIITAFLLIYAAWRHSSQEEPRGGGYHVALLGGLTGLLLNVFVFGAPALIDVLAG